jgi:hypothetical protein
MNVTLRKLKIENNAKNQLKHPLHFHPNPLHFPPNPLHPRYTFR